MALKHKNKKRNTLKVPFFSFNMSPRPSVTRVAPAQDQISNISDIDNPTRERRSIEVDDPDFLVTKAEDADQGSVVEKLKLKSNSMFHLFMNSMFLVHFNHKKFKFC